ncbi:MAG: DUF3189 family protein [Tepidanaerobacteraceae bacterium]|nr:DUF3189 family protein [Tepidanaerobacteraceae bacterium]
MKVIYSCYWGSYLAVVAASLHLGLIDFDKYNKDNIITLTMFDKIKNEELGELFFIGTDAGEREVYVMGSKSSGEILQKTFKGIAQIYGFRNDLVCFINLNAYVNGLLFLGVFFHKSLGFNKTGIKLILKGIEKNYNAIKKVVQNVKNEPIYEVTDTEGGAI